MCGYPVQMDDDGQAAERIAEETICPLCLARFPPFTFLIDYPCCSDCGSEGMDFDVEPFRDFLAGKTIADLEDMLRRWDAVEGLRPQYKQLKRDRIAALIDLKRGGAAAGE